MWLYNWDVITSALQTLDCDKICRWAFATAGEGARPSMADLIDPWKLPAELRWMASSSEGESSSIIDIDIGYFTNSGDDRAELQVFSDQYVRELGSALCEGLDNNGFGVVTVALSPSTTGSWQLAEDLCWALLECHPGLPELRAGAPQDPPAGPCESE